MSHSYPLPTAQAPCAEFLDDFLAGVRRLVQDRLAFLSHERGAGIELLHLLPGKMLRTRLAARIVEASPASVDLENLRNACAAIEIVHTATLCHDDVVDNALLRRAAPTLWREVGSSGAILVGDILLCESISLIVNTASARYAESFTMKVREVCAAEAEHEIELRGRKLDERTCLRLARGKTGPLFAFAAEVCGGDDEGLCIALEEAGYRIGTAYQLADDLLDIVGAEQAAGKTLRTDLVRRKFTLPQSSEDGQRHAINRVSEMCSTAVECLTPWPAAQHGVRRFITQDLNPILSGYGITTP